MSIDFFFSVGVSLAICSWGSAPAGRATAGTAQKPGPSNANAVLKSPAPTGYCTAAGGCDEYISRVQIGALDRTSACAGYEDHSGLWTVVTPGQSYVLTVTNGNPIYSDDCCAVWVDWNHDSVWSGAAEYCGVLTGTGPYEFTLLVPPAAAPGYARLRIRIDWNSSNPQPCGTTAFGEVEDYSLLVTAGTVFGACCEAQSGTCADQAPATACESVGLQFYPDTTCVALIPPCGNPGACCSDVTGTCESGVPELSCAGTRFLPIADCIAFIPPCGQQSITFVFDPGTGPPPATACGLAVTPLDPDPRPLFDDVTSIPTPCPGSPLISFSIPLNHRRIGAGWGWWSHGYTGDVYYTNSVDEVTLSPPSTTCAVYFYIQPNTYNLETFHITVNGTFSSGPFPVHGSGAAYVGICGTDLQTIRINCASGADFGIGEFGICCSCEAELCACCDELAQQCEEDVDLLMCIQNPQARFILGGACADFQPPCGQVRGACCYDYACELQRPSDCTGEYFGDGSVCRPNPCSCADTVVAAPGSWTGTTCGMPSRCDISSAPDVFFEVLIPHWGLWLIEVCGSSLQVQLEFGATCCDTFGYEQQACGSQPYLEHVLSPGSYFVTIEGWTGCGLYTLNISELPWGACCDSETALCLDVVLPESCHGTHAPHEFCADLDPPCSGPLGACCDDSSAACIETSLAFCTGRFAPLTACADLHPQCGLWRPCLHWLELYDSYGDGWTDNTLDLYVNRSPVLAGLTLAAGSGPDTYYFEAGHADEISTVFNAYGGWPEEAYYVILSGREILLVQDGDGLTAPTGVVVHGECPEPCGDLDLDFDVDIYDYDLFFDSLSDCRGESHYLELADLDHDGCVTMGDFELWLECYEEFAG